MARRKQKQHDPFEEAAELLTRAKTARERLRAQEAIRAALALEMKDFARSRAAIKHPSAGQLKRLEKNYADAWREFERQRDAGMDHALRALAGVREALAQLRYATASQDDDMITVSLGHDGKRDATWTAPRATTLRDIPEDYRGDEYRSRVQLQFAGGPDIYVFEKRGKSVVREWS